MFRTIGATAVLLGIALAAMAQFGPGDPSAIEITSQMGTESQQLDVSAPVERSATTTPRPFEYRIGLLAGVSTANFWEYIGDQPTVWNAYVLGPTKPAMYGIDRATNALVPDFATSAPVEPTWDERGWRVRVEVQDLAWSDGAPITSADVVYTFETVRRLGLEGGWAAAYPAEIEGIVAESDTRLRIELSRRPSLQTWPHAIGLAPIMPAHVWAPLTDSLDSAAALYELDGSVDVSGGPLMIATIDEGRIESVANPSYTGPAPDRVAYDIFPDEKSAVAALKAGKIDTVLTPNGLSAESVTSVLAEPGVAVAHSPANSVRYLGFNLTREPMSAPAFRQAVALLLDRQAATESVVPDAAAAYTMLTPANKQWFEEDKSAAVAEIFAGDLPDRLSRAVVALEDAGYAWATPPSLVDGALRAGTGLTVNGLPPSPLTILTPGDEYDPARPDYTQRIETTLQTLGFDVRPVITDFDTVIDLTFNVDESGIKRYDMYVLGWTLGNPALPDYYRWLFASDGPVNSTGYADPGFDALLEQYEQATDLGQAKTALWEMEKTLAEDLPYLVLYHPEIVEAYRSDRLNFENHALLGGLQGRLGGIGDLTPAP